MKEYSSFCRIGEVKGRVFINIVKIEYDEFLKWKAELEAEQKVLIDNCEKLEEKFIQANVRYRILNQISEAKEELSSLEKLEQENNKSVKEMNQRLATIDQLLPIINSEIMIRELKEKLIKKSTH